jgi:hypothetical protein
LTLGRAFDPTQTGGLASRGEEGAAVAPPPYVAAVALAAKLGLFALCS